MTAIDTTPAATLARPLTLPAETLPNRLVKSAMTEGLADPDGQAGERLERLYAAWARGGAGLLISGNVLVDRHHRERPGNVLLEGPVDGAKLARLRRWTSAARSAGAGFWMQVSHAGRQTPSLINPTPRAPSAVPLALPGKRFGTPVALDETEIRDLMARFVQAAVTAREAGFTGVQMHAAHGYLISSFLSPRANARTDGWGGSLEHRARFLRETVQATRRAVGRDFTVSVKLNSADFQKGGFAPHESLQVAAWLEADGVDVIEISGGSYEQPRMAGLEGLGKPDDSGMPSSTAAREAYFLDFAVQMRARLRVPLLVTGGFRTAQAMARAVREDGVALVGLARPLVADPDVPARLLEGAAVVPRWEDLLRAGPGWLGPRSPLLLARAVNGMGAMAWYYTQLRRMADGLPPDRSLGILRALVAEERAQRASLAADSFPGT